MNQPAPDAADGADLLERCAGPAAAALLERLRPLQADARRDLQSAFDALWRPDDGDARAAQERALVALRSAALLEDDALLALCRERALGTGLTASQLARVSPASESDTTASLDARLTSLMMLADRVALQPASGTQRHLDGLLRLRLAPAEVVGLAQATALMAAIARLLSGLRALAAAGDARIAAPADGLVGAHHPHATGPVLRGRFTLDALAWKPWVPAVDPARATAAQLQVLDRLSPAARRSAFELTLLHNAALRAPHARLVETVVRGRGGLPWSERALVAAVVSRLDGCTYGASALGRIFSRLTRDPEVIGRLFAQGVNVPLAPRRRLLADLAVDLAAPLPRVAPGRIEALRGAGFGEREIVDAIQAAAMAAGDDRLALTLGEPVAA